MAYPPPFDRARAVFAYDDHSRRLILAFKHADHLHGMPAFGQWLARSGAELMAEADLVAPVPLHWTRLFRRRFNQSALLAQAAVAAWRGPASPAFAPDLAGPPSAHAQPGASRPGCSGPRTCAAPLR